MKPLYETSKKFPNNFLKTQPIAIIEKTAKNSSKVLHVQITRNSDINIPLTSLKAQPYGDIDLQFFGVPLEVRQRGKVLLYGIFKGDYLDEHYQNQKSTELIGIPYQEFTKFHFKSHMDAFISPIFLGAPIRTSDTYIDKKYCS